MPEQTPSTGPSTGELRALRMTAQRLAGLVAARDTDAVVAAVRAQPRLLATTVERSGDDWTPLHLAVATGDLGLVDALLGAGADLEATTDHGRTPLHVALEFAPDLVDPLLARGAEPDGAAAAFLGDTARLAARLDAGESAVRDGADVSLLGWAAFGGSADTVRLLLERGADPDTGRTALHDAVGAAPGEPRSAVVRALLAAGADVESTTSDGASAVDIARVAAARDRAGDGATAAAQDDLVALLESAAAAR